MTTPLSPDQIEAFKAQFDLMDQNGDGRISAEEISTLLEREAYSHLGDADRQRILDSYAAVDTNGDGVAFDEFLVLVTPKSDPREEFRKVFAQYDVDGDGFLTAEDFKRITALQGEVLTTEQANEMIQMADGNHDGKVSFDEYYTIMTSGGR